MLKIQKATEQLAGQVGRTREWKRQEIRPGGKYAAAASASIREGGSTCCSPELGSDASAPAASCSVFFWMSFDFNRMVRNHFCTCEREVARLLMNA